MYSVFEIYKEGALYPAMSFRAAFTTKQKAKEYATKLEEYITDKYCPDEYEKRHHYVEIVKIPTDFETEIDD